MALTTLLIFLDGIYRINYIPLIYHLIDLEHTTIPLTYLLLSQGLDSRSFPSKICKRLQILGFKIQILGKSSWIQALDLGVLDASQGLDSRIFLRILNLESRKICKRLHLFGIQDSRFWGKVLEPKPLDLGVLDASQGLDSRTFRQNLESWTQENLQTFVFFWDSRFKIQDNFWGFNVCVCTWVFTWLLEFYCNIWHPPQVNQNMAQNCNQKYKLKMCITYCKPKHDPTTKNISSNVHNLLQIPVKTANR